MFEAHVQPLDPERIEFFWTVKSYQRVMIFRRTEVLTYGEQIAAYGP